MSDNERRLFSRIEFKSSLVLIHNDRKYSGQLKDISLKGALVSLNEAINAKITEKIDFELKLDETDIVIFVKSQLRYIKDRFLGIQFEGLNLESMQHLRRLVELNAGDPDKIKDELFFLAQ